MQLSHSGPTRIDRRCAQYLALSTRHSAKPAGPYMLVKPPLKRKTGARARDAIQAGYRVANPLLTQAHLRNHGGSVLWSAPCLSLGASAGTVPRLTTVGAQLVAADKRRSMEDSRRPRES